MAWQSFLAMGESTLHVLPRKWKGRSTHTLNYTDTDTHLAVVVEESQYYQYSRNHTLPVVRKMRRREFIATHRTTLAPHGLSSPHWYHMGSPPHTGTTWSLVTPGMLPAEIAQKQGAH